MSPHPAKTHHQTGMRSPVPLRVPRFVIPHPDPILFPLSYLSAFKTKRPHKKSICLPMWVLAVRRAPPCMFVLGKMSVFKVFTEERASFLELWHIWDPWLFSWRFPEVKRSRSGRVLYAHAVEIISSRAARPPSTSSFLFFFWVTGTCFFGGGGFEGVVWPPRLPLFPFCGACLPEICLAWKGLVLVGFCRGDRSVSDAPRRGVRAGVVKDGACGSGAVGHKGSWPRLYREKRPPPSIKITCFCESFIRNQLQRRQTHTHLNLKHFITHSHTHVGVTHFNALPILSLSLVQWIYLHY